MRAQLLARRDAGAENGEALFVRADQPFRAVVLGRRLENAARLAGVWRQSEERRPPWHAAPTEGHTVELVALEVNWNDAPRT